MNQSAKKTAANWRDDKQLSSTGMKTKQTKLKRARTKQRREEERCQEEGLKISDGSCHRIKTDPKRTKCVTILRRRHKK